MVKKAVVFLADGFEEVEAVTPIDFLRRAGVEVTTASIGDNPGVRGAHGIPVLADVCLAELDISGVSGFDAVLVPGGMPGASNIAASGVAGTFIREMDRAGKLVCAICAAPAVVLAPLGLLEGRRFTCYPGMEDKVQSGTWSGERVVTDGRLITSRGVGTAAAWSLAIIRALLGEKASEEIAASTLQ